MWFFFLVIFAWELNFSLVSKKMAQMNYLSFEALLKNTELSGFFVPILMSVVISILVFSYFYMETEKMNSYFYSLFTVFVLSMLSLSYSKGWLLMMMSWDWLGISSYLLVIFYFNSNSNNSGAITLMTNRVGDIFLMGFVSMTILASNSLLYPYTFNSFFLVLCLITKSAQFPFSAWLPAAMAAPTPISALVHSSTLVTAGLLIFYVVENTISKAQMMILLTVCLSTSFLSGFSAMAEKDMKKLIALSTLSQLSFMFMSLSTGLIWLSFFHLLNHALFKSSLFFCAGSLIHQNQNEQHSSSFKKTSSSILKMLLLLVFLNLLGLPFTAGFLSKDLILDNMYFNSSMFLVLCLVLSVSLTWGYSFRMMNMLFLDSQSSKKYKMMKEDQIYVSVPFILFFFSVLLAGKMIIDLWYKMKYSLISIGWKTALLTILTLGIFLSLKKEWPENLTKMLFLSFNTKENMKAGTKIKNMESSKSMDYGWLNSVLTWLLEKILYSNKKTIKSSQMWLNFLVLCTFMLTMNS